MTRRASFARAAFCIALALAAAPAAAQEPTCTGSLSGAVSGSFSCTVTATERDGRIAFRIAPSAPIPGVRSVAGAFELKAPLSIATYSWTELAAAEAAVTTRRGRTFRARKGPSQRGDYTVSVGQLEREAAGRMLGAITVRTRLVAGSDKEGTVAMNVQFTTVW